MLKLGDRTDVVDIVAEPPDPPVLFACAWEARHYSWGSYLTPVSPITTGLPVDYFASVVRLDPMRAGLLEGGMDAASTSSSTTATTEACCSRTCPLPEPEIRDCATR